jgi:hypothetical protein
MKKRTKYQDVVTIVDGVKITMCAARMPRKTEKTYSVDQSKYTAWNRGVTNFRSGSRGVQGTVDSL